MSAREIFIPSHSQLLWVFKDNPRTLVNEAVWASPLEIFCFMIMPTFMIFRRNPKG